MARLAGARPVIMDCPAEQGYMLTAQQLRAALTPQSRLLILCTPSNPTGAVYSLERLEVHVPHTDMPYADGQGRPRTQQGMIAMS